VRAVDETNQIIQGFGETVGGLFSVLNKTRIKIVSALKLHPHGLRWSELEELIEKRGGTLDKALNYLIDKEIVEKTKDNVYVLTGFGDFMFRFCLNIARYFAHTTVPPQMTNTEFRKLKEVTDTMLEFLKKNKYQEYYLEALP
jgi:Mn-dependent DtxR family transcriptional regulator